MDEVELMMSLICLGPVQDGSLTIVYYGYEFPYGYKVIMYADSVEVFRT